MNQPLPPRSPRAERAVQGILESIPFDEKADKEKVLALVLEHLVAAVSAELTFKKLVAEGLKNGDPITLIAAVQAHRDGMARMIAGADEPLGRQIELKATGVVERIVNRLTNGEFRAQTDNGNMLHEGYMRKALAAKLREVASAAEAAYDASEVKATATAQIEELLTEANEGEAAPQAAGFKPV
jgi:hypothetical protein